MTTNTGSASAINPSLPYFDESRVRKVLRYETLVPAMERALADFSRGEVVNPVRSILPVGSGHGFFGIMPAVYGGIFGAKLVTLFPNNAGTRLPTHQGIIVLFNSATGEPIAMMDGRMITEMRTAATSAVAVKWLAKKDANVLAILGSGVQARAHYQALSVARQFSEIRVWSRNSSHAENLAKEIGGVALSAEEAVRNADVVVTVTHSQEPVLYGRWLKPGAFVSAVGAVGRKNRELDSDAMKGVVVVDSRDAAEVESGDIFLAGATIYAELGEIVAGKVPRPEAKTTVFESLGLAVEDLASAKLVLEANAIAL
jgi:ornithine cyclodeaminase/alanine dehydrogenase-like protein (mu-crystallin family)